MTNIERNRFNYNNALKIQRDTALSEEWQRLNGDIKEKTVKDSLLNSKKTPFQEQQAKLAQLQSTIKTNKTKRVNSVNQINIVNNIDAIPPSLGVESTKLIDFKQAERFDMKQDVAHFIRPTALNQENLKKETLNKIGHNIISYLELADASETLIKRAKSLLEEENIVKSVADAYRNALIFS